LHYNDNTGGRLVYGGWQDTTEGAMNKVKTALVVMNDPTDAWAIGRDMLKNGFSVTTSASGQDGFDQLERRQFDCLVVGGAVRGVSLNAFLAHCQRYYAGTRAVVLTDDDQASGAAIILLAGARYCLPKSRYMEAVTEILAGKDTGKSPAQTTA
jgi:CheY-like chemotaxis protein